MCVTTPKLLINHGIFHSEKSIRNFLYHIKIIKHNSQPKTCMLHSIVYVKTDH